MSNSSSAERFLESRLARTATPTKYIAAFRLPNGREIALERERQGIHVWTAPLEVVKPDLCALRERYAAAKTRNSNLNAKNAPSLRVGRPVDYWRLRTLGDIEELLSEMGLKMPASTSP